MKHPLTWTVAVAIVVALLFACTVWPTPWRYEHPCTRLVRINRFTSRADILLDDGGHTMKQQIVAFDCIYPTMAPDGVYLVEDTHTSLWGGDFADIPARFPLRTFMGKAHADTLRLMEWSGRRENFGTLMSDRRGDLDDKASDFCRSTAGIHFYDSIVVYERGHRVAPGHGLR